MTPRTTRWLRFALIVVFASSAVAVVWNLLSGHEAGPAGDRVAILSPDVSHRTTQFEYLERRKGRPVFRVSAETSTETMDGLRRLDGAHLSHFDTLGKISEAMSGRLALYDRKKKEIEFLDDVDIRLPGAIEVRADRVRADLSNDMVLIQESFYLQKGEMSGTGRSLVYDIAARKVKVRDGLQVNLVFASGPASAQAGEATYWLSQGLLELRGAASLSNGQSRLAARDLDMLLSTDGKLQKIQAFGNARFSSADQVLAGDRIEIDLASIDSKVRFWVGGDKTARSVSRALYMVDGGPSTMRLEAAQIGGMLAVDGASAPEFQREQLSASGDVRFRAPSQGVEKAQAESLRADFSPSGSELRTLELDGQFLTTGVGKEDRQLEEFRGETLKMRLSPDGAIRWARASTGVTLRWRNGAQRQQLSSPHELQLRSLKGGQRETTCSGECVFRISGEDLTRLLHSPFLRVIDAGGELKSLRAEGGVKQEMWGQSVRRKAESKELVARYEQGKIREAVQSGDVRLSQKGAHFQLIAKADRAVHEPAEERLRLEGGNPTLIYRATGQSDETQTTARTFLLDQSVGRIVGMDRVASFSTGPAGTVVVVAGRMEMDSETGWVNYFENPRIVQGSNTISGKVVQYDSGRGRLVVQEDVVGVFVGEGTDRQETYRVGSQKLTYDPQERRVRWEGEVRIQGAAIDISAPTIEGILSQAGNEFERFVALGKVRIVETKRSARGEEASYYPSQRKVVLRGEKAEILEQGKGKASGRQLTFYLDDETLLIEEPE